MTKFEEMGSQVLEGLGITADQFIDVCILCGCDYCGTIRGASFLFPALPALLHALFPFVTLGGTDVE